MPGERRRPSVFTPSDEPYLGRQSVFRFDQVISACLDANRRVAPITHRRELSNLQRAAAQIVPQGINLALSIRELVRQGYLFAAAVLLRPLIERAAILSYLHENPSEVALWEAGWVHRQRPGLPRMLATMHGNIDANQAGEICEAFNHLVHGDPLAAEYNLVDLGEAGMGYAVGKALSEPDLCDFICLQAVCFLVVVMGRMHGCFPEVET